MPEPRSHAGCCGGDVSAGIHPPGAGGRELSEGEEVAARRGRLRPAQAMLLAQDFGSAAPGALGTVLSGHPESSAPLMNVTDKGRKMFQAGAVTCHQLQRSLGSTPRQISPPPPRQGMLQQSLSPLLTEIYPKRTAALGSLPHTGN